MTPYFEAEFGRLYHGDCLEIMPQIPDGSIDAVICDPPFQVTACKWDAIIPFEPMWKELKRIIKKNGAIVLFGIQPFTSALVMSNPKMFKYEWVWVKPQGVDPFMTKIRPLNNIEYALVFSDGKAPYFPQLSIGEPYKVIRDKTPRTKETNGAIMKQTSTINPGTRLPVRTLYFNQEKGLHPTQKPTPLGRYLIRTYTNEGDTILDFTTGSGSFLVSALLEKRKFIGIEKELEYVEVSKSRIETEAQKHKQLELFN